MIKEFVLTWLSSLGALPLSYALGISGVTAVSREQLFTVKEVGAMEPKQNEASTETADPQPQTAKGRWHRHFIKGELGLAWTFWYHGILAIFILKFVGLFTYALDHSGNLALFVAVLTLAYLCALLIAVWNAVQKYEGSQVWAILAVLLVIVAILNWVGGIFAYLKHAGT